MKELCEVLDCIDERRLTQLLVEAVGCYSPSGQESPAAEVFEGALAEAGIPMHRHPVPGPSHDEERCNLLATLGPEPPALLLVGHMDTIALWSDEELNVQRDGDIVHGLGSADMKSGCSAMIEALTAVAAAGTSLKRGVQLALVVGEEDYGDGVEALIEDGLIRAPLTLVGEPTDLKPCTRHYGYIEYEMAGEGTRVHAALARKAGNAIHATLDWVSEIFSEMRRLPFAGETSVSLREIRGGTSLFVVPNKCELVLDVHLPPGEGVEAMDAIIEDARSKIGKTHSQSSLRSERLYWAPGYVIEQDEPLLKPIVEGFRALDMPWDPAVFPSHSDASQLHRQGTVPVVCGPGKLDVAHTPEECVSLSDTTRAARLYAAVIHAACIT